MLLQATLSNIQNGKTWENKMKAADSQSNISEFARADGINL